MIEFKSIAPSALRTSEPFKTLMPFDMRVVELLAKSMKKDGFDYSTPIVVWKGHNNTVIDGHLRLAAALTAGIPQVWIYERNSSPRTTQLSMRFIPIPHGTHFPNRKLKINTPFFNINGLPKEQVVSAENSGLPQWRCRCECKSGTTPARNASDAGSVQQHFSDPDAGSPAYCGQNEKNLIRSCPSDSCLEARLRCSGH